MLFVACTSRPPSLPHTWSFSGKVSVQGREVSATEVGARTARVEHLSSPVLEVELRIESGAVSSTTLSGPSPLRVEVWVLGIKPGHTVTLEKIDASPAGPDGNFPTPALSWSATLAAHDAGGTMVERLLVIATPSGPARLMQLRPD